MTEPRQKLILQTIDGLEDYIKNSMKRIEENKNKKTDAEQINSTLSILDGVLIDIDNIRELIKQRW